MASSKKKKLTPKNKRLIMIVGGVASIAIALVIIFSFFRDNLVFYYSPSDFVSQDISHDKRIRVGGLVRQGSLVVSKDNLLTRFILTDGIAGATVEYTGLTPFMFRENQGVVAEGIFQADGLFKADKLLVRHDEKYMPSEIVEAIKESGQWKGKE